jgi:regulator of sigma E protease
MVHELGHFLCAKKAGVYVYEFSLGMGPKIISHKKGETDYSIRLFPIGGFVSMAGEDTSDTKIPSDRQLCNKSLLIRFITMIAGITFNILLAIILLFVVGLINGNPIKDTTINSIISEYPISNTNIKTGDVITHIDNVKVSSYEDIALELTIKSGRNVNITVRHSDNTIETNKVKPIYTERGNMKGYSYGFSLDNTKQKGIVNAIKYSFKQTKNLVVQMYRILYYLVTGNLSFDNLSGPIGIYTIVGSAAKTGFLNIIYLIAYLCINVAVINLLPFPAFDGGRILFLIIEKIKGSKVNPKIENSIHTIGFILLMTLMLYVSYNDIIRLFTR